MNRIQKQWAVCALISGSAFLVLALLQEYMPDIAHGADYALATALIPHQTFGLVQASLILTVLGGVTGILAIAAGSAFFLRKHAHLLARLIIVLIGSSLSVNTVKVLIAKARPETILWLDPFLSYSFPSGHATMSMALFGFLLVAIGRLVNDSVVRVSYQTLCVLAILLVGASRITLGAHYLTDVLGGYLLGLFWVAVVFSLPRR